MSYSPQTKSVTTIYHVYIGHTFLTAQRKSMSATWQSGKSYRPNSIRPQTKSAISIFMSTRTFNLFCSQIMQKSIYIIKNQIGGTCQKDVM